MNKIAMTNQSKALDQIMAILGIDSKRIIAFTLDCKVDKFPVVTLTYYPEGKELLPEEILTNSFDLVVKE